jgi:predicted CXXCH cytochrome family protein
LWILWGLMSIATAIFLGAGILGERSREGLLASARIFMLPGKTTHGHYQIELACESCHTESFTSQAAFQEACVGCHGAELKDADDKHPLAKFTDPRNAELLERIDAAACITCHTEHRPGITNAMGVTQPNDVCVHCHADIAQDRPSHAGMAFDTCAASGCHNFHDNRALYEDFLLRHLNEAAVAARPQTAMRNFIDFLSKRSLLSKQMRRLKSLQTERLRRTGRQMDHWQIGLRRRMRKRASIAAGVMSDRAKPPLHGSQSRLTKCARRVMRRRARASSKASTACALRKSCHP